MVPQQAEVRPLTCRAEVSGTWAEICPSLAKSVGIGMRQGRLWDELVSKCQGRVVRRLPQSAVHLHMRAGSAKEDDC